MSLFLGKQWQSSLVIDQIFKYPEFGVWFLLNGSKPGQLNFCQGSTKLLCWPHVANRLYEFFTWIHLPLSNNDYYPDRYQHKTCPIYLPVSVGCWFGLPDIDWGTSSAEYVQAFLLVNSHHSLHSYLTVAKMCPSKAHLFFLTVCI